MTNPDPDKPLAELVEGGTTVMFGTMMAGRFESRPLTIAAVDGNRLSILVDTTSPWVGALSADSSAHLTVSDTRENTYVSLDGDARVHRDPATIERLWTPFAGAFFEGKDDPRLAVLEFDAESGSYWTAPSGRIGSLVSMVRAKLGDHDDAGDHGDVAV